MATNVWQQTWLEKVNDLDNQFWKLQRIEVALKRVGVVSRRTRLDLTEKFPNLVDMLLHRSGIRNLALMGFSRCPAKVEGAAVAASLRPDGGKTQLN